MNPARLRDHVDLYTLDGEPSPDSTGQYTSKRRHVTTLAAEVTEDGGQRSMNARRPESSASFRVEVRNHPELHRKAEFDWEGKTLKIDSIRTKGRLDRYAVCQCRWVE